ncbi:hypothetical protein F4774DRAFT_320572 [Daldinia eschscholtzii]|nr:hypothetical protein F4774DRAFT_320572 [Daldinia eschscholtzii]
MVLFCLECSWPGWSKGGVLYAVVLRVLALQLLNEIGFFLLLTMSKVPKLRECLILAKSNVGLDTYLPRYLGTYPTDFIKFGPLRNPLCPLCYSIRFQHPINPILPKVSCKVIVPKGGSKRCIVFMPQRTTIHPNHAIDGNTGNITSSLDVKLTL